MANVKGGQRRRGCGARCGAGHSDAILLPFTCGHITMDNFTRRVFCAAKHSIALYFLLINGNTRNVAAELLCTLFRASYGVERIEILPRWLEL